MSALRRVIEDAKSEWELTLKELTVLSPQRDPYRLDTPKNHEIGKWFANGFEQLHEGGRIHLRGLHYKFVGRVKKPNGELYINSDDNWQWFSNEAAKSARYLGYVSWESIRDARNSPPQIFTPEDNPPEWRLFTSEVELTLPEDFNPEYRIVGTMHRQPWRQIVIAEKQGVEELLLPVCQKYEATLCLPGGEISDTLVYDMLRDAAEDGRPLAIHQLGDFDPAGYQMAVSTARKVQAMVDTIFPWLQVVVHTPALTREQCEDWDLPNTPLKETELRASKWMAAHGWEQTELDAAVALAPKEFVKAVTTSLKEYFDTSVVTKGRVLRVELEDQANDGLDISDDDVRDEANRKLSELTDLVYEVNEAMHVEPEDVGLEPPESVEAVIGNARQAVTPLIDTNEEWTKQTQRLISRKKYEEVN